MGADEGSSLAGDRVDLGIAAVLGAIVVAVVVGAAVPYAPFVVALVVVALVFVYRFGLTTVLLHALVLSMFVEGTSLGGVRVGRLLAVVVPVVLFLRYVLTRWRPQPVPALAWVPGLLFLLWSWVSGFWAGDADAWLSVMGSLGLAAAYFLGFALLVDSPAQVRELLRTFVLGAFVLSFVALAQAGVNIRSTGFQGDPNIFALYQVAAIPVAGMLSRTSRTLWGRLGWLVVILPIVASVFASQSRGGLLTLALVLPIALIRGDFGRITRGHTVVASVVTVGVLGTLAVVAGKVDNRLSIARVLQDRGTGRLDIWQAALAGYQQHPLLGLGAGGFEPQSSHLLETTPGVGIDPFSIILRTGIRVHNIYLESLTELGPIGLLLWIAVLVGAFVLLVRIGGFRIRDNPTSPLVLMLTEFTLATLFLSVTNSKLLWMVVGLTAAAASARFRAAPEPSRAHWSPSVSGDGLPRSDRGPVTRASEPVLSSGFITYSAPTGSGRRGPTGSSPDDERPPGPDRD